MDVIAYVFTVIVALDHPQLPHTSFVVAAEHRTFCEAMREMYSTDPAVSVSSKCVESRVRITQPNVDPKQPVPLTPKQKAAR